MAEELEVAEHMPSARGSETAITAARSICVAPYRMAAGDPPARAWCNAARRRHAASATLQQHCAASVLCKAKSITERAECRDHAASPRIQPIPTHQMALDHLQTLYVQ